ncbi:SlyX family protein [Microbulbifer sp. OS29]|uniref:SlyX family protein n=1 Tax=Microbulbifer okhotskensis TaxID=2926617 RepID=A0A9X2J799_9GAMM|nr:SlyX family protein [Microbulbifer okhotskensis]MCO1334246.1 SlyX family protein [Microbulbifer okhotskensis]
MTEEMQILVERIDELESRLAFQEDTISGLNDVITRQDADIRTLLAHMRELGEKYRTIAFEVQGGAKQLDEKPPHY